MRRPSVAEVLRVLGEPAAVLVRRVLEVADSRELRVYLVGGPVRDLLLERPLRDADLLVEGRDGFDAAALAEAAAGSEARVTRHDRFGTVVLRGEGGHIDLATMRRETYSHDGALPNIEPGTLEEDLRRRDFTVDALALPLSAAARSRHAGLLAPEGGLADLEARTLRIFHRRSFHDDPTRALRAARLGPRLGFTLSRDSRSALRGALRDGSFGRVSGDRLRREFVKVFEDAAFGLDPAQALRLLADWHVLGALEPGLLLAPETRAPLRRVGRAVTIPPWPRARWRPWVAGLAVWLAPLAPALRRRALQRIGVRGDQARRVTEFPRGRDTWLRALNRTRGRGATDVILAPIDEESLHALHAWAPPPLRRRIARYAAEDRGRHMPMNGDDLLELGFSGPALGRALLRIRAAWLDGAVTTRVETLALGRELARRSRSRRAAGRERSPRR